MTTPNQDSVKFANETAGLLEDALYPKETAREIVAEVIKNGSQSEHKVMLMLIEYGRKCVKNQQELTNELKNHFSKP